MRSGAYVTLNSQSHDEDDHLMKVARTLDACGGSFSVDFFSLPRRGGFILQEADIVDPTSLEYKVAQRSINKKVLRDHRIAAKRSLADAAAGTEEERKRIAVELLSSAQSTRSYEELRMLSSRGAQDDVMTIGDHAVGRSEAICFSYLPNPNVDAFVFEAAIKAAFSACNVSADALLLRARFFHHNDKMYIAFDDMQTTTAFHNMRHLLLPQLVDMGHASSSTEISRVVPKRALPQSEGVRVHSRLPSLGELESVKADLVREGIIVVSNPLMLQADNDVDWVVLNGQFVDGLCVIEITKCPSSWTIPSVKEAFPSVVDVLEGASHSLTGLSSFFLLFSSMTLRDSVLVSQEFKAFLQDWHLSARALRRRKPDTWLFDPVSVITALMQRWIANGGKPTHSFSYECLIALWADSKYMGTQLSFLKIRLLSRELFPKTGASFDGIIGIVVGHESEFLGIRHELIKRLKRVFSERFDFFSRDQVPFSISIHSGYLTGDDLMQSAFYSGNCNLCGLRAEDWKVGKLIDSQASFDNILARLQERAQAFIQFKANVAAALRDMFDPKAVKRVFKDIPDDITSGTLDAHVNRLAKKEFGIPDLFLRGVFRTTSDALRLLSPYSHDYSFWFRILSLACNVHEVIETVAAELHTRTQHSFLENLVEGCIVHDVRKLDIFASSVGGEVLPIIPASAAMHMLMTLTRSAFAIRNAMARARIIAPDPQRSKQAGQVLGKDVGNLSNSTSSPLYSYNLLRNAVAGHDVFLGTSATNVTLVMDLILRLQVNVYDRRRLFGLDHAFACLELAVLPVIIRQLLLSLNDAVRNVAIPSLRDKVVALLQAQNKDDLKKRLSPESPLHQTGGTKAAMIDELLTGNRWHNDAATVDIVEKAREALQKLEARYPQSILMGKHAHKLLAHLVWVREDLGSVFPLLACEETGEASLALYNLFMRVCNNGTIKADVMAAAEQLRQAKSSKLEAKDSQLAVLAGAKTSPTVLVLCPTLLGSSKTFSDQLCQVVGAAVQVPSQCGRLVRYSRQSGAIVIPLAHNTSHLTVVCFNRHAEGGCAVCARPAAFLGDLVPFSSVEKPVWATCNTGRLAALPSAKARNNDDDDDPVLVFLRDLGFAPHGALKLLDGHIRAFFQDEYIKSQMYGRHPPSIANCSECAAWLRDQIANDNHWYFYPNYE